jgi:hypothetical protein
MTVPLRRLTLFQHGLGFFGRSGRVEASFEIDVARRAMDDVLKSLTVVPDGAVLRSIAFETPADRNPNAHRSTVHLDEATPLSSLVQAFAGRSVAVQVGTRQLTGLLIGLEREADQHLKRAVLVLRSDEGIEVVPLSAVQRLTLTQDRAAADLAYALEERGRDRERARARISLSAPCEVDLTYTAPAPAWRTSYRVLIDTDRGDAGAGDGRCRVLVQALGLFDNTLDEDLEDVELTLTAGMPVSFRYELHQPNTPDRPLVRDERRTLAEAFTFDAMPAPAVMSAAYESAAAPPAPAAAKARALRAASPMSLDQVAGAAPVQAVSEARGALFAYRIADPVSIRRGESGMVPIAEIRTDDARRELLYHPHKTPEHPSASIRFRSEGAVLEHGPATVHENGDYAGEAIVPFTAEGSEVVLGFALELGVRVSSDVSTFTDARSLSVRDGGLFLGVVDRMETRYVVESSLGRSASITVEHPRSAGWELRTEAVEESADAARFAVVVRARSSATLTVSEQRTRSQYEHVDGLDSLRLQQFLAGRVIDDRTHAALAEVVELTARRSTLAQGRDRRDEERGRVRERLDDARSSLSALDASRDGALRDRFISQLEQLENRLVALDADDDAALAEDAELDRRRSALLSDLALSS